VISLDEAESQLARQSVATVLAASGLDDRTGPRKETIRWFARQAGDAIVIALLERRDDQDRQEVREAGRPLSAASPTCWSRSCGARPGPAWLVLLRSAPRMPVGIAGVG
jgi:hypothetical protein